MPPSIFFGTTSARFVVRVSFPLVFPIPTSAFGVLRLLIRYASDVPVCSSDVLAFVVGNSCTRGMHLIGYLQGALQR